MALTKELNQKLRSKFKKWKFFLNRKQAFEEYTYEKSLELIRTYDTNNGGDASVLEQDLFKNIISVRNKKVQDIMVPRTDIVAIEEESTIGSIFKLVKRSGFSRFPVYKDNLDDVIGFIHIKDIMGYYKEKDSKLPHSVIRPIIFISPYMKIFDLLYEMRIQRTHMAMIADEFGGVDGLITMEDVIEEIVGEIADEHDRLPKKAIEVIRSGVLEADAKISLEELEEYIGVFLSDEEKEEFNTLGGLIISILGYIPLKNELIVHKSGVEFKILSSVPVKINKVCVYYGKLLETETKK